jgi:hypothetical protein
MNYYPTLATSIQPGKLFVHRLNFQESTKSLVASSFPKVDHEEIVSALEVGSDILIVSKIVLFEDPFVVRIILRCIVDDPVGFPDESSIPVWIANQILSCYSPLYSQPFLVESDERTIPFVLIVPDGKDESRAGKGIVQYLIGIRQAKWDVLEGLCCAAVLHDGSKIPPGIVMNQ